MLELGFDGSALQRLDNAAVVSFLTSAASALSAEDLLSAKDVDDLRVSLSAVASTADSRDRPVLLELDRIHADFLQILSARYGTIHLCLNVLRHSLRAGLADTRRTLADFGQALVKKAELNFNRPVTLSGGGRPQKHALYSTLIIDFSQALADASSVLEAVSVDLSAMYTHAMAGGTARDRAVDLALAKALGFDGLTQHSLPGLIERGAKRKLATALLTLAEAAQGVAEAVGRAVHGYATALACEALVAECQRLQTLELPASENLVDWEVRRQSLVASLKTVNLALTSVAAASLAAIGTGAPDNTAATFPEAIKRRIITDLIATGIGTKPAWSAAEGLFRYVAEQHVTPDQLIPGELPRIHAALTSDSLATLQRLAKDRSTMSEASTEKADTMARAKKLATRFQKCLAELAMVALVLFAAGCGLKTKLVSDVVELRPDIPFREAPKLPGVRPHESVTPKK